MYQFTIEQAQKIMRDINGNGLMTPQTVLAAMQQYAPDYPVKQRG